MASNNRLGVMVSAIWFVMFVVVVDDDDAINREP